MDDVTSTLPAGDVHWDGETLTVGGVVAEPGRHRLGDTGMILEVVDPVPDED